MCKARSARSQPESIGRFITTPHAPARAGDLRATGIEEGAAGIGWVELQAWHVTRDAGYLAAARGAGDWLLSVARRAHGASSWSEDVNSPLVHTSLDNGAPGIGWFLHDLWRDTGQPRYELEARRAVAWLAVVMRAGRRGTYRQENFDGVGWRLPADSSWHWGTAGIGGFLARMAGASLDGPGEEPGMPRPSGAQRMTTAM